MGRIQAGCQVSLLSCMNGDASCEMGRNRFWTSPDGDRESAGHMSQSVSLVYPCVLGITETRKWGVSGIKGKAKGRLFSLR